MCVCTIATTGQRHVVHNTVLQLASLLYAEKIYGSSNLSNSAKVNLVLNYREFATENFYQHNTSRVSQ